MSETTRDGMPQVEIFTDGACSGNPGPGGWAYLLRGADGREIEAADGERRTTNNRMELLAAIRALDELPGPHAVTLYSDSQYLVKGLNEWLDGWIRKGWTRGKGKPVMNQELWEELDRLRKIHRINPVWVRGHDDHAENERVDRLAVAAAERAKRP